MSGLFFAVCVVLFVVALAVIERQRFNSRHKPSDLHGLQRRRAELIEYLHELDNRPHTLREMLDAEEMLFLVEHQIERASRRSAHSAA